MSGDVGGLGGGGGRGCGERNRRMRWKKGQEEREREVPEEVEKGGGSGRRPVQCGSGRGCVSQRGCRLLAVKGGDVA